MAVIRLPCAGRRKARERWHFAHRHNRPKALLAPDDSPNTLVARRRDSRHASIVRISGVESRENPYLASR